VVPRVKICCIQSVEEARLAIGCGANALGLVSAMPSGFGPIPEDRIAVIAASIPPGITSVLLTSATDVATIIGQQRRCRTNAVQLVDTVVRGSYEDLRGQLPGVSIIQVIHVRDEYSVAEALGPASRADALLLDSGNPTLAIKELGGTERIHDWELSRRIVDQSPRPVFLAGGLNAGNVADAIRRVRPFGVDVCTGLRVDGRLDSGKLTDFMAAVSRGAVLPAGLET